MIHLRSFKSRVLFLFIIIGILFHFDPVILFDVMYFMHIL